MQKNRQWHSFNVNDYANSTIHSCLNSTFLGLFDANIQAQIKQALKAIRRRIQSQMNGLDDSAGKVRCRIRVLDRLISRFRKAG